MRMHLLWLTISGGIGTLLRYFVSGNVGKCLLTVPVRGTLVVNLLGCFLFGLCYALFEKNYVLCDYRIIVLTGFLGGFTTMSAFAGEVWLLLERACYWQATGYVLATNVGAIAAVWLGFFCISTLAK